MHGNKNTPAFEHRNTVKNFKYRDLCGHKRGMIVETFEMVLKSWYDTTNFTKTAISINNNFNNNERQ